MKKNHALDKPTYSTAVAALESLVRKGRARCKKAIKELKKDMDWSNPVDVAHYVAWRAKEDAYLEVSKVFKDLNKEWTKSGTKR